MKSIVFKGGELRAIDSTKLPYAESWVRMRTAGEVASAIREMKIRGAPLIGVAAAYGLALEAVNYKGRDAGELKMRILNAADNLRSVRPTGRNLSWALDRCLAAIREEHSVAGVRRRLLQEANAIAEEDVNVNLRITKTGLEIVKDGDVILTHCNTGGLGTVEYGTALGIIRVAWENGRKISVIATETRPLLQGARLTTWELKRYGIPFKLICDSAAGYVMSRGLVSKVLVGADRVLATGHVTNKVGTLTLAVLAKHYKIPFHVAAPLSTFDLVTKPSEVPIEERNPKEVTHIRGRLITVRGAEVMNPAFDITPPELISGIITERGILNPPYEISIAKATGES